MLKDTKKTKEIKETKETKKTKKTNKDTHRTAFHTGLQQWNVPST
jgi:hypothetical protein